MYTSIPHRINVHNIYTHTQIKMYIYKTNPSDMGHEIADVDVCLGFEKGIAGLGL